MPIFKYLVLNGNKAPEYIEVEQSIGSPPLSKHPISGEPLKKIPYSPSLTLSHSTIRENSSLSSDRLKKHGFSIFQKDDEGYQEI